jgi:hypothetical protein
MQKQFVVMVERSAGNESVGSEWTDTGVFSPETTLRQVWEWQATRSGSRGRVMLNVDEGPAETR